MYLRRVGLIGMNKASCHTRGCCSKSPKEEDVQEVFLKGVDLDALLNMSTDDLVKLFPSRIRRRFSRGLTRKPMALIKKLRKAQIGVGNFSSVFKVLQRIAALERQRLKLLIRKPLILLRNNNSLFLDKVVAIMLDTKGSKVKTKFCRDYDLSKEATETYSESKHS